MNRLSKTVRHARTFARTLHEGTLYAYTADHLYRTPPHLRGGGLSDRDFRRAS